MNFTKIEETILGKAVSFPLDEKLCIVIGENGSGKTLLLETLKTHLERKGNHVIFLSDSRVFSFSDKDTYWYIFEEETMKGANSLFKKYDIKSDKLDIEPNKGSYISAGKLQLANLFCLLHKHRNEEIILLIDEPEKNLSLTHQNTLLSDILTYENVQKLIVATHSPEILSDFHDNIVVISNCVKLYGQ